MWAFALGPPPPDAGFAVIAHPYTLLMHLPGFSGLRVPARFAMLGSLCLAIATGLAFARVMPGDRRRQYAAASVVLAGLAIDGWTRPMPLIAPPGRMILPSTGSAAVLELPAHEGIVNAAAMYRSMRHGRPLVNGYSGHVPPHYRVLAEAITRGDPSVMVELARGRALVIVVNDALDPGGALRRLVETLPGVEASGSSGAGSIFVLPPQPLARVPPVASQLTATVRELEVNSAEIDLGSVRVVRTVEFLLRWHAAELDPRIKVEASGDRAAWSTVWEDWTGGRALAGALDDPLLAPVRLHVSEIRARYLRIHPAPRWLWRELKVYGF
jgi:hypothetical protein